MSLVAIQKGKLPLKHMETASSMRQRGVKIIDAEEASPTKMCSKYDPVSSLEVRKLRESLKSSSLELQAVVEDPLPDSLHKSDIVRSELAMKGISHEPPLENQSRDVDVPEPNACRSIVLYQPIDAIIKKNSSVNWSNVHRPNLMERNSTAHTYEVIMFIIFCFNLMAGSFLEYKYQDGPTVNLIILWILSFILSFTVSFSCNNFVNTQFLFDYIFS